MSENDDSTISDLMKKIIIISKNIKTLTELIKNIDEKINQPKSNNEDDKEKMNKIFEKKQIGRPAGSFEDKQKQYMDMLNKNKLKVRSKKLLNFTNCLRTKRVNMKQYNKYLNHSNNMNLLELFSGSQNTKYLLN